MEIGDHVQRRTAAQAHLAAPRIGAGHGVERQQRPAAAQHPEPADDQRPAVLDPARRGHGARGPGSAVRGLREGLVLDQQRRHVGLAVAAQIPGVEGGRRDHDQPRGGQQPRLDPAQRAFGDPLPQHHPVNVEQFIDQPPAPPADERRAERQHFQVAGQQDLGPGRLAVTCRGRGLGHQPRDPGQRRDHRADALDHAPVRSAPQHHGRLGQRALAAAKARDSHGRAAAPQHLDPPPHGRIVKVMGEIGHAQACSPTSGAAGGAAIRSAIRAGRAAPAGLANDPVAITRTPLNDVDPR